MSVARQVSSVCRWAASFARALTQYCDDKDASVHHLIERISADTDEDGHGAGAPTSVCASGVLPIGYAYNNTDCDYGQHPTTA